MQKKVILITGASSGFGYELAKDLALKNHIVYGVARRKEKLEDLKQFGVNVAKVDVLNDDDIENIVNRIIMENGKIDIVYCNAGYGHFNTIENTSVEEAKHQFDVNVFGVDRIIKNILPYMKMNRNGRIIITTSVVANVSVPFGGWYSASKHALKAMAEALMMEVRHLGIKVITIEPGHVKTEFGAVSSKYLNEENMGGEYVTLKRKYESVMKKSARASGGMKSTIKSMVHAGLSEYPKINYKTTYDSKGLTLLKKVIGRDKYYKKVLEVINKQKL